MARTKEAMAADIETSLKNLKTDYIDLYQVHNPGPAELDQILAEGGALEALSLIHIFKKDSDPSRVGK